MTRGARVLLRDYAALAGGEVFAKGAAIVAFAYLARVLGPSAYGSVELAVALGLIFGLVVDFGLWPIGSREVTRDPERARALASHVPAARVLLAVGACAGMALVAALLNKPPETRNLVLVYALALFAAPWTLNWLFLGLDLKRWVAAAQPLRMAVFAGAVVLLVSGPADLLRVGGAELAGVFAMAAYFVLAARHRAVAPGLHFELHAIGRLLRDALPVGVSQLLWALNQYLPTVLVATLVSDAAAGFYGGAHRIIVMGLGTFVYLHFFNLYPSIVRAAQAGEAPLAELMRHSFRATAWVGCFAALGLTLLAEPISLLVYGARFGPAALPFAILAWVLPVTLQSGHARFGLIGTGHPAQEMLAQGAGLVVTVGAGLVLVARFGAAGAAVALVASALVVWIVAHAYARSSVGPLPFAGPLLRPAAAAVGAGALALVLPLDSPWLRGAFAGLVYAALGALLEPRLLADVRALLGAGGAAAPDGAAPGAGS